MTAESLRTWWLWCLLRVRTGTHICHIVCGVRRLCRSIVFCVCTLTVCVAVGGLYYPLGGAVWTLRLETGSRVCRETTRTGRPRLMLFSTACAVFLSSGFGFSGDASRQPTHLGPRSDKHDRALGSAFSLDESKHSVPKHVTRAPHLLGTLGVYSATRWLGVSHTMAKPVWSVERTGVCVTDHRGHKQPQLVATDIWLNLSPSRDLRK